MRAIRPVLVAMSVLLLSGCVVPNISSLIDVPGNSTDQTPDSEDSGGGGNKGLPSTSPKTGERGGTFAESLGAGAYSPKELGNKLFSPCVEITEDQWKSLGWRVDDTSKDKYVNTSTYCTLKSTEKGDAGNIIMASIRTGNERYEDLMDHSEELPDIQVHKPENVYLYDSGNSSNDSECSAGLVTNRGRLEVTYRNYNSRSQKTDKTEICQHATDLMVNMLNLPIESADGSGQPTTSHPANPTNTPSHSTERQPGQVSKQPQESKSSERNQPAPERVKNSTSPNMA